MPKPTLIVVFGYRSMAAFEIIAGLGDVANIVWLIDDRDETAAKNRRLLARTGAVVDAFGLDAHAAAEALRPHQPDGIVTFYDRGMAHIAAIAAELGLRFHSVAAARALEDKLEQRLALTRAGVPSPMAVGLPASDRAALMSLAGSISYPAVVKPRTASGSWQTGRVDSAAELADRWEALRAREGSLADQGPDAFLVEEYLPDGPELPGGFEGDYVSVETIANGGELHHLAVTGRFPLVDPFRETGYFIPATIDATQYGQVIDVANAALTGVGFHTGCAHTELKLTADGWRIIEINGRIGGGVPDMLRISTGLNLIRLTAQAALGCFEPPADLRFGAVGYRFFYQPPVGRYRLVAIDGVQAIREIPGVETVTTHHSPGTELNSSDGTRTYLLAIVGRAPDHATVQSVEQEIRRLVRVEYEELGGSGSDARESIEQV